MSRFGPPLVVCLILIAAGARPALAQVVPGWNTKQFSLERIDADRVRLMREVEIEGEPGSPNAGQKFFADDLQLNTKTGELTASGNVVFSTPTSRISAETVVFNTHSKMGTFKTASGISQLTEKSKPNLAMFGGVLEPDVYFYGETIEKIGPDKYRITKGGFTTCVQPAPRWEIVANHAVVNLRDYVVMRNAVVTVKHVPVFYLPMLYYPIQDDDRATGFLMPLYGASTYRGQSLSNAFFWAVNRSQDVTFMHDWLFSRGIGMGSEYRYMVSPSSQGNVRAYWLNEHESVINGQAQPARKSTQVTGGLTQALPFRLTARARVDYFSDVTVQQLYNNNFYNATLSTRTLTGGVSGAWRALSMNANYQRTEQFYNPTTSRVSGSAPGVTLAYSGQKLGFLPIFASINVEATKFLFQDKTAKGIADFGLSRVDVLPSLRAPLSTLPYFTANATVAYRTTYFSESLDPVTNRQIETPVSRNYADLRAEMIGPVFSKVFSPNNAIADRLKHVIEPSWSVQRRTKIDNQNLIPITAGGGFDTIIGGSTQMNYGLANRVMVRKTGGAENDPSAAPRELLERGAQAELLHRRARQPVRHRVFVRLPQSSAQSVFTDCVDRPRGADAADGHRTSARIRPGGWRQTAAPRIRPERHHALDRPRCHRRLEPPGIRRHHGRRGVQLFAIAGQHAIHQREGGRNGGLQLGHRALDPAEPALSRVLQRAVLRDLVRIPVVQLPQHVEFPGPEGPAVQHLVHAGGRGVVLELPGCIRRRHI